MHLKTKDEKCLKNELQKIKQCNHEKINTFEKEREELRQQLAKV